MKKLVFLLGLLGLVFLAAPDAMAAAGKCKWCGSASYGRCAQSPYKVHEHVGSGSRACVYCGSSSYGSCRVSPAKKHRHGSGDGKCVWCGAKANGACPVAPHKRHEK